MLNIFRSLIIPVLWICIAQASPVIKDDLLRISKSQDIVKYMNKSVNPCENFYEFTCGNYEHHHHQMMQTTSKWNVLYEMNYAMEDKIKAELQHSDAADTAIDRKVKSFYKACVGSSHVTDDYRNKLKELVSALGHMPVLEGDGWQEDDFDWANVMAKIVHNSDIQMILGVGISPDLTDYSVNRALLAQPEFALQRQEYVDPFFEAERQEHTKGIAYNLYSFLGIERQLAKKTAQEIMDFEIALAHGIPDLTAVEVASTLLTYTPIEELQKKFLPVWDTKKIFDVALDWKPTHVIAQLGYLDNAVAVLEKTPKRVVANYVFYTYLSKYMRIFPVTPNDLATDCLRRTQGYFNKNIDNMMYRKFFTEQDKQGVQFLWHELKATFEVMLQLSKLDWIQDVTRKQALEKIRLMKLNIESHENVDFTKDFAELNLSDHDYVANIESLLSQNSKKNREMISQPPRLDAMGFPYSRAGPYYENAKNTIQIPIKSLQPSYLWSRSYPYAWNFAALGFYVAHEMVHGFDDEGRMFDTKGINRDWWDAASAQEFRKRTKCFVQQYHRYVFGGVPLPESPKQYENIADNGGIRLAYEAYLRWYDKVSKTMQDLEVLPGVEYNHKQLFFISFGHSWCTVVHPRVMAIVAKDTHAPEMFRVIGSLSNFEEFSKVFNCPVGSAMNPENKCEIY